MLNVFSHFIISSLEVVGISFQGGKIYSSDPLICAITAVHFTIIWSHIYFQIICFYIGQIVCSSDMSDGTMYYSQLLLLQLMLLQRASHIFDGYSKRITLQIGKLVIILLVFILSINAVNNLWIIKSYFFISFLLFSQAPSFA